MAQAIYVSAHLVTVAAAFALWLLWQHVCDDHKRLHSLLAMLAALLRACLTLKPLLCSYAAVACTLLGWKLARVGVVYRMFSPPSSTAEPVSVSVVWNWAVLLLFSSCFSMLCSSSSSTSSLLSPSSPMVARASAVGALCCGIYLQLVYWKHYLFWLPLESAASPSSLPIPEESQTTALTTWVWMTPLFGYAVDRCTHTIPPGWVLLALGLLATALLCSPPSFRARAAAAAYLASALLKVALRGLTVYHYMDFRAGFPVAIRFILFVVPLLPAFLRVAWAYLRSPSILRDVCYRRGGYRCELDIYLPPPASPTQPTPTSPTRCVLVFVSGGAWMMGNKGWVSLAGMLLSKAGVLFVAPDYPNFPEATAEAMVTEIGHAMRWVFANIGAYGGDPQSVFLCGQSAGANIVATLLLRKALFDAQQQGTTANPKEVEYLDWGPYPLRGALLTSGFYNIKSETSVFSSKGVSSWAVHEICAGDLSRFSPTLQLQLPAFEQSHASRLLPRLHLSCASGDKTVPPALTFSFAEALRCIGVAYELRCYPGRSHTSCYIEDALEGNSSSDVFLNDVLHFLQQQGSASLEGLSRLDWWIPAPTPVIQFARWVNPL